MTVHAVFFDVQGTLARFIPEQEGLLVSAAAAHGITLSLHAVRRGFAEAADWWQQQMNRVPLEERSPEERETVYRAFDQRVLQAAGVSISPDAAYEIFRELMRQAKGSRLVRFEDVVPTLTSLQGKGVSLGVISNMGVRLPRILADLGLDSYFTIVVSAGEVGVSKPQPGIFQAAVGRAGVPRSEAIYVGDQYENDVLGARGAGLFPIMVDRYDLFPDYTDCVRIHSLQEVALHLENS